MTILAVSPFLWTMGNGSGVPTLFKTLEGFARETDTHLLMPSTEAGFEVRAGIQIHKFKLHGWSAFGPFGPDRSVFSHLLPGGMLGRFLFDKLLWLHFVLLASIHAIRLNRTLRVNIHYGVTPYGAPVALLMRLLFGGINVTRLLGTFLTRSTAFDKTFGGRMRLLCWLIPHFTEVVAFLWPAACVIVTDDGTKGAEVGRVLGISDVQCWRNGVNAPSDAELRERSAHSKALRERFNITEGSIAVYTGQLVSWKRVDRLLRAVAAARTDAAEKLTVVLVGDGPERRRLEALSKQLELRDSVRFAGSVAQRDLQAFYLGASFFACAHDLTCACNSTFEAMAAGLAVVATDVGETSSIVGHESEGLLVDVHDEAALARAIASLASDEHLRDRLGRSARTRLLREFGTWPDRTLREYSLLTTLVRDLHASQKELSAC